MTTKSSLQDFFQKKGLALYRFNQLLHAVYKEGKNDYQAITVFPKELKSLLRKELPIFCFEVAQEVSSPSGDTVKTLFKLKDGKLIEAVLMRFRDGRNSVCVSSQVGCGLKCSFCATGTMGFLRNLTAEEISDQVLYFYQYLKKHESRVNHVIFMGMGEPFLNYEAVMQAVRTLNDPELLGIAARHITISTSGVIPGIEKLSLEKLQINLAVSLHAPNQVLREKLMPIAKPYPVLNLMGAIKNYIERTHRRISYEYVMLKAVNDTPELAQELGKLIRGQKCHVNLIPYNETYLGFQNSGKSRVDCFREILESYKIPVTVRVSLGQDISAACGQLALTS